jgi:mycothiol synthase
MNAPGGLDDLIIEEFDAPNAPDADHRARYDFNGIIHEELDSDEPRQPFSEVLEDSRKVYEWSKPLYLNVWDADRRNILATGFLGRQYLESNRHLSWVNVQVHPDLRRQGIATELLRRLVAAAKEDGRTILGAQSNGESAGVQFLPVRGFEPKQVGRLSRLHTKAVDRALMEQWVADAATGAADYELFAMDDRVPDELVDKWLAIENVMNTAPRDDLEMEDFVPNVERFRTHEKEMLDQGYGVWRVFGVHKETGDWAGYSELYFSPHHPEVVEQGGTAVDPAHRGHGIGRWVKAVNILRLLDEKPEAERVETWNAKSNGPMLDINIAMGFDVVKWYTSFQAPIEAIEATL